MINLVILNSTCCFNQDETYCKNRQSHFSCLLFFLRKHHSLRPQTKGETINKHWSFATVGLFKNHGWHCLKTEILTQSSLSQRCDPHFSLPHQPLPFCKHPQGPAKHLATFKLKKPNDSCNFFFTILAEISCKVMQTTSLVRPVGCFLMVLCPLHQAGKEIYSYVSLSNSWKMYFLLFNQVLSLRHLQWGK